MRNMGRHCIDEVTSKLAEFGFNLLGEKIVENEDTAKEREIFANMDISYLNLSLTVSKCLARAGVSTIGELLRYGDNNRRLINIRGMGAVTLKEIVNKLAKYGYKLRSDDTFVSDDELPEEFYELIKKYEQDLAYKAASEEKTEVDITEMSIKELGLSTRAYNALSKVAGLKTVGEVLEFGDLKRIPNLGEKSYQEIINKLDELGHVLNESNGFVPKSEETTQEPVVKDDSIEILRTELEEKEIAVKEKEEKSKLLDEAIELAEKFSKLKETESKLDEEIKRKEEMLKGFGLKHEEK